MQMRKDFLLLSWSRLGGRLVNLLPESAKELFRNDEEGRTPAELALKWLYNQPEVTCVLSGMNSMEMVEQNVKTASESHVGCLTTSDAALIEQVKEEIKKHVKVGCTGCGYCMPCPRGVDIPGTFRCYNAMYSEGKNPEGKIIYNVRLSARIRQVLHSVSDAENVRHIVHSILKSEKS